MTISNPFPVLYAYTILFSILLLLWYEPTVKWSIADKFVHISYEPSRFSRKYPQKIMSGTGFDLGAGLNCKKKAIYITLKHECLLCVQGPNYFPPVSLFWLLQYHAPLCSVISALSRYIISNHGIAMAYTHSLCSNYSVLIHLPIEIRLIILECHFRTNVMDWVHGHFLWNCSQVNSKEHHWW